MKIKVKVEFHFVTGSSAPIDRGDKHNKHDT